MTIDPVRLGERLQRIDTDVASLRRELDALKGRANSDGELITAISKWPWIGPYLAPLASFFAKPTPYVAIIAACVLLWGIFVLSDSVVIQHWVHKNFFRTPQIVSHDYLEESERLATGNSPEEDSLFALVSSKINELVSKKRKLLASSASGSFYFDMSGDRWLEQEIPIYFLAARGEKAWFYVRLGTPNTELQYSSLGETHKMRIEDMFMLRGARFEDGTANEIKLRTSGAHQGFFVQRLSENPLLPSIDEPFHKFDLIMSPEGKTFLEKYAKNWHLQNGRYPNGYRLEADIMVTVVPNE